MAVLRECRLAQSSDTLLLIDLTDHLHDGDVGGAAVLAEDGVLVGKRDDDAQVVGDGALVVQPLLGGTFALPLDAAIEADAGEGKLVGVLVGGHGFDAGLFVGGDVSGVDPVLEGVGVASGCSATTTGGFIGAHEIAFRYHFSDGLPPPLRFGGASRWVYMCA